MRVCSSCKADKLDTDFHKGRRSVCKECRKSENESNRLRAHKYYEANTTKVRQANKEWAELNRDKMNQYKINWRASNQLKRRAHYAVDNALRSGKLTRLPCVECGNVAQAHHQDYNDKLRVVWLCASHHSQLHKIQRGLYA